MSLRIARISGLSKIAAGERAVDRLLSEAVGGCDGAERTAALFAPIGRISIHGAGVASLRSVVSLDPQGAGDRAAREILRAHHH